MPSCLANSRIVVSASCWLISITKNFCPDWPHNRSEKEKNRAIRNIKALDNLLPYAKEYIKNYSGFYLSLKLEESDIESVYFAHELKSICNKHRFPTHLIALEVVDATPRSYERLAELFSWLSNHLNVTLALDSVNLVDASILNLICTPINEVKFECRYD
jgi:EAL domain-containing protein (putative c-di-GMP-specific phosphodiesterase class I)